MSFSGQLLKDEKQESRPIVKLLVTDYDRCAFTLLHSREDGLSEGLIDLTKKVKYTAFYGCTSRCYLTLCLTGNFINESIISLQMKNEMDDNNYEVTSIFTHRITENLKKATGLPCLAVSTPDDFSDGAPKIFSERCGFGYEKIIKPWEEKIIAQNKEKILSYDLCDFPESKNYSIDTEKFYKLCLHTSKNLQLATIIRHARVRFPTAILELHYLDDRKDLCLKVSDLSDNLLEDVSIQSFQHDEFTGISANIEKPLVTVGSINQAMNKIPVSLVSFSFLASLNSASDIPKSNHLPDQESGEEERQKKITFS